MTRVERRHRRLERLWQRLAGVTARGPALVIIGAAALLAVLGWWKGRETPIGDTQAGVPELRANSRYNLDNDVITSKFNIGVDVLTAIVESREPVCVSHDLMTETDRFAWHMRNVPGVQDVITLPFIAKIAIAGLERGQPQVAQHSARAGAAHAVDALHRDQHRTAQRELRRRAGA